MPFQKGQSGNPKGRPKSRSSAAEQIEKMLSKKDVPTEEEGKFVTRREHLFDRLYHLSVGGDTSALKILMEHWQGRPSQKIEQDVTTREAPPITLQEYVAQQEDVAQQEEEMNDNPDQSETESAPIQEKK